MGIGHSYYYNASTKESTYTRPTALPSLPTSVDPLQGGSQLQSGVLGLESLPIQPNNRDLTYGNTFQQPLRQWGGPREAFGQPRGFQIERKPAPVDRPKSKCAIPGCAPWMLIKTKLGRRFVYNPEAGQSFWRFPPEVMKFVVEFDRIERERRKTQERGEESESKNQQDIVSEEAAAPEVVSTVAALQPSNPRSTQDDSDEYEEVEVTDDEDEENPPKHLKTDIDNEEPIEFDEDDIAYQLAAMGQDYGLDPGEYGDGGGEDWEEGAEGLPLTEEDTNALFRDMLGDYVNNPYTPWEKIIEEGKIIEDDRYTVLPNMKTRKDVWARWSRDKIQQLKEQREKEELKDPLIPYLTFLQKNATPKLYWPEFRRKYKKEPEMRNTKVSDKEREKWYRDYINRTYHTLIQARQFQLTSHPGLKLPETSLKSGLTLLLKSLPPHILNRSTNTSALPPALLTDLRYVSLRSSIRDPMIETYIATLPSAPEQQQSDLSPSEEAELAKQKAERERRERALAEREKKVQEEKRRQRGALQHSKGMLRDGEEEIERAMKVGREGLMGHFETGRESGTPVAE